MVKTKGFDEMINAYNKEHSKQITPKQTILYNVTKIIGSTCPEKDVLQVSSSYKAKYFYEASARVTGMGCDSVIRDNCPLLGYFLVAPGKILH